MIKPDELSNEQLIQAIKDADKADISMEQLPILSRSVIEQYYNDYTAIDIKMASQLGYEVPMGGRRHKTGKHTEVYFNLEGIKLNPYRRDKDDWDKDDKKGWECFKLVFPLVFSIPDGTNIIVNNDNDWDEVKAWYKQNPEADERYFQYPVKIMYRDNLTVLLNK